MKSGPSDQRVTLAYTTLELCRNAAVTGRDVAAWSGLSAFRAGLSDCLFRGSLSRWQIPFGLIAIVLGLIVFSACAARHAEGHLAAAQPADRGIPFYRGSARGADHGPAWAGGLRGDRADSIYLVNRELDIAKDAAAAGGDQRAFPMHDPETAINRFKLTMRNDFPDAHLLDYRARGVAISGGFAIAHPPGVDPSSIPRRNTPPAW